MAKPTEWGDSDQLGYQLSQICIAIACTLNVPCEDSDQPGHLPKLIRVSAGWTCQMSDGDFKLT